MLYLIIYLVGAIVAFWLAVYETKQELAARDLPYTSKDTMTCIGFGILSWVAIIWILLLITLLLTFNKQTNSKNN